ARSPLETMLLLYGAAVAFITLNIRQPWPYMFVLLAPTAFVLHAYLFSRALADPAGWMRRPVAWTAYVTLGLLWPLSQVPVVARAAPGAQRQTFELAQALLRPGERYFAGFQFLPRLDAHDHTLGMVDTNTAHPVHALSPAEHAAILERFREEPIRFLVYTPVIDDGVPPPIRDHLFRNYAPFWGNVWLYAPQCRPADSEVNLLFPGRYTVETERPGEVRVDGRAVACGDTVELARGRHAIRTSVRCRLRLQPEGVDYLLDPAHRDAAPLFWPPGGPVA